MYKLIILFGCLSFVGCSKPSQKLTIDNGANIQYPLGQYLDTLVPNELTYAEKLSEKITVYTSINENNEPIKMASCKGCHFVCSRCTE